MESTHCQLCTRIKTEDLPRISVWRMLTACVIAFCIVSFWIIIAFPGRGLKLWFYFAYMTVACTFLPLPTPQMAMAYGLMFNPFLTAVLGGIGSCISGIVDYSIVTLACRNETIARAKTTRTYRHIERFFNRVPFIILMIAAFTPIPFEPVKLLACASRYNRAKFILAVFVGRTPRYFLLGMLQRELSIPGIYLYGSIIAVVTIEVIRRLLKRLRPEE